LDDLPRELPVSLIKLDVEGFEPEVIDGAWRLIEQDRPTIFGEFSQAWMRSRSRDLRPVLRRLEALGYRTGAVSVDRRRPWRAADRVSLVSVDIEGTLPDDLLLTPGASF
jgi:hypothetical protein